MQREKGQIKGEEEEKKIYVWKKNVFAKNVGSILVPKTNTSWIPAYFKNSRTSNQRL